MQNGLGHRSDPTGIVLSDLHLFAQRSRAGECLEQWQAELSRAEVLVLNGDTFDFRWSTIGGLGESQEAAVNWLREIAVRCPRQEIHFVMGNHDCIAGFPERLDSLTAALPRFHWHEYSLRLGATLFLHGDCTTRRMTGGELRQYRARWRRDSQRGRVALAAYQYADRLGLTSLAHVWQFPRRKTVKRVAYYLDHTQPGWSEQIQDCYFGHTHRPFSGYVFRGVRFHNTGSAIRGMRFDPQAIQISAPKASIGPAQEKSA